MDTASASSAATAATDLFVTDPFYPLETARNEILAALRADESSPDADLFRRIAHSANSYDAGAAAVPPQRQGFEYRLAPATAAFLAKTGAAAGFVHGSMEHRQSIPLPSHLAHTLAADTKLFSLMGAFPEAHMVWLSVDNTLYLWEYQAHATIGANGRQDYVAFEVPSGQCIVSVGLVPPKPGTCFTVIHNNTLVDHSLCAYLLLVAHRRFQTGRGMVYRGRHAGRNHTLRIDTILDRHPQVTLTIRLRPQTYTHQLYHTH
jgi:hypothetical protein